MDSLTARLMSTSGLSRTDPLLPPVSNMRMVHLKQPFGPAEKDLHEARVALKKLEDGSGTTNTLYMAMAKLEGKEQDYFARRYFGRDRAILKGWNVGWKQNEFKKKITSFVSFAKSHEGLSSGHGTEAKKAAGLAHDVANKLEAMNNKWYPSGSARIPSPPAGLDADLAGIDTAVNDIRATLRAAEGSVSTVALVSIKTSLRTAENCQRLARLVKQNRWDLPDNL